MMAQCDHSGIGHARSWMCWAQLMTELLSSFETPLDPYETRALALRTTVLQRMREEGAPEDPLLLLIISSLAHIPAPDLSWGPHFYLVRQRGKLTQQGGGMLKEKGLYLRKDRHGNPMSWC
jgi:hypothetical protein